MKYLDSRPFPRNKAIFPEYLLTGLTMAQRYYQNSWGKYQHHEQCNNRSTVCATQKELDKQSYINLNELEAQSPCKVGDSSSLATTNKARKISRIIQRFCRLKRKKMFKPKNMTNIYGTAENDTQNTRLPNNSGTYRMHFDKVTDINKQSSQGCIEGTSIFSIHDDNTQSEMTSKDIEAGVPKNVPSIRQELKHQISNVWHIFTGETTAHGYKRTHASHRSRLGRYLWALAVVGVTCIVLGLLFQSVMQDEFSSIKETIKYESHRKMVFPAVTVCSLVPYDLGRIGDTALKNYSGEIQQLLLEASTLRSEIAINSNATQNSWRRMNTRDLDEMIGWRLDTFIKVCRWNGAITPCSNIFTRSLTATDSCFTFNFNSSDLQKIDKAGSFSGLSLVIQVVDDEILSKEMGTGIKVLLHEPTHYPNSWEHGTLVASGTIAHISVEKRQRKLLPLPYKAYGTDTCSDDEGERRVASYYNYTGYSSCVAECRLRIVVQKCNCTVYNIGPNIPGIPFCSVDEYINCYIPTLRDIYTKFQFYEYMSECTCPLPCQMTDYIGVLSTVGLPASESSLLRGEPNTQKDQVVLKFFYKELITRTEEQVATYTWVAVFGNIGGQMGLFTGASVLTILEFLELALLMTFVILRTVWIHFRGRF